MPRVELGALLLEDFDVARSRLHGKPLRQQEVPAIPGLHVDNFATLAQVTLIVQENDFHASVS